MASLSYVGKAIAADSTIAYKGYVDAKAASMMTQAQVDSRIAELLSGYATRAQVDAGDADGATLSYVQAQDALRVPVSWKGLANGGPATLTSGKVTASQLNATGTQRLIKKMYSPAGYGNQQTLTTNVITLYTVTIADPGYAYRVQAFAFANVTTSSSSGSASITARVGSTTGATISRGIARMSSAGWSECTVVPIYSGGTDLTGSTTIYFTAQRNGGSGTITIASLLANAYVQVTPV